MLGNDISTWTKQCRAGDSIAQCSQCSVKMAARYSIAQCSQCSLKVYNRVQYRAQCSGVQYRAQCSRVQYRAQCSRVQYRAQCSRVQCSRVQYRAVQHSTVQMQYCGCLSPTPEQPALVVVQLSAPANDRQAAGQLTPSANRSSKRQAESQGGESQCSAIASIFVVSISRPAVSVASIRQ